jgi:hypothetical protein
MMLIRMLRSQGVVARDVKYYVMPIIGIAVLALVLMSLLHARI